MPWKETDAMKEKRAFIDAMPKQTKPFRQLCREFGISEKTGYKWRSRFLDQGYSGLKEESRRTRGRLSALAMRKMEGKTELRQNTENRPCAFNPCH